MDIFAVKTEHYEGPLETVVDMLRSRQLHISDVSLAQIADDFTDYIDEKGDSLEEISSFLRVMSVLLLIKIKALLPDTDLDETEEETIAQFKADLERISLFSEIKSILKTSKIVFLTKKERPKSVPKAFRPDPSLEVQDLKRSADRILSSSTREDTFARVAVKRLIDLGSVITKVENKFRQSKTADLDSIINKKMDKSEKVVHFLAVLELLKQGVLMIEKNSTDDRALLKYNHIETPNYGN